MEQSKPLEQLAREAKAAYSREWRAKNKDRVKQINAKYWERRALKMKAEKEGRHTDVDKPATE